MTVALATGALVLAHFAGQQWGWAAFLIAPPLGLVCLLLLLLGLGSVYIRLERAWPPECESGRCRGDAATVLGDYEVVPDEDERVYRCQCGHEYVKVDRRFMRRLPDGTLEPWMVWKLFRGYVPDADAP